MKAIELFGGGGGFAKGFSEAGIQTVEAIELNPSAVHTYNLNHGAAVCQQGDIREWSPRFETPDIVYGGPSCQGLSTQGKRDPNDARNLLMWEFRRIVRETKPAYFVMENVPALTHAPNVDLLSDLINGFRVAGYRVCEPWLLNAADYGVGQSRRRLFLVGYRGDMVGPAEPNPLPLNKCQTAGDVLSKPYSDGVTGTDLTIHSVDVIDRYTACPPGTKEPISRFMKLSWDKPSPTVTAQGRLIHPLEPRILSVREAARIQSFPDSYQFPKSRVDAYMQIGNAVCPLVAKAIGLSILKAYHSKVG